MGAAFDIAGKKFGKLTAVSRIDTTPNHGILWNCVCDCGQTRVVSAHNLTSGATCQCKKCGQESRTKKNWDVRRAEQANGLLRKPELECQYCLYVTCQQKDRDCRNCGWCPAVSERRKKQLKAKLSKK